MRTVLKPNRRPGGLSPTIPRLSVTEITNPKVMKKCWCVLLLTMLFALGASAEPNLQIVVTNDLSEPYGVTVDLKNNAYITDSVNNRIAKY